VSARVPADLKVEMVDIDSIRPLERNPRRGDVEFVRASLQRFGQYVPIVVRAESGEILKGNHTWFAAKEEGHKRIAIVRRSVPDDAEAQRLALTDNRASDLSEWDVPELADVLQWVDEHGGIDGSGFVETDLSSFIAQAAALAAPDEVEDPPAPDPPARPKTRPGDLITLGRHRLFCGSSIDARHVGELLDGLEPLLINTDPPYGVELDMEWRDRAGYHWQHEPCWVARRKGSKVPWHGPRDQPTIIRAPSPKRIGMNEAAAAEGKWDHPTQKPLAVCMPPIANHLLPAEYVYEPFAGSGSTLIAAEHLDRGCAAMEINPAYCDVIVERWEQLTGEKAQRPQRQRRRKKETAS
jgi:hypothetical protein